MDQFTRRENIHCYRRLLEETIDQAERWRLQLLLAEEEARDKSSRRDCPACRDRQAVIADIALNRDAHRQDGPRVLYLRCTKCAQVQVVEE